MGIKGIYEPSEKQGHEEGLYHLSFTLDLKQDHENKSVVHVHKTMRLRVTTKRCLVENSIVLSHI